jgi:hypothetical protein
MSVWPTSSSRDTRPAVAELRKRFELFSFEHDGSTTEPTAQHDSLLGLDLRPGGIIEWLAAAPGAGALASALQVMWRRATADGVLAIVDPASECYAPALPGWGISHGQTLIVRPTTRHEACWAIEQCLRCPGVWATWAWVEHRNPARVHRRWQLAAEQGGGVGIILRPESARREPVWADVRLLVTPRPGGRGETRQVRIDVLYHRGGLGGTAQIWEIDHAEGVVRLVPAVANSTAAE